MKIFNPNECKKTPRADMFLPDFLKYLGFVLDGASVVLLVGAFVSEALSLGFILGVVICGGLGIAAGLCWKNQTIRIIDDQSFEYTTFLGRTTVHNFSDITALVQNKDSFTLVLTSGKIHIESMVYMSEKLFYKINSAINKDS